MLKAIEKLEKDFPNQDGWHLYRIHQEEKKLPSGEWINFDVCTFRNRFTEMKVQYSDIN